MDSVEEWRFDGLELEHVLRVMLSSVSQDQRTMALEFLARYPNERSTLMSTRAAALPAERFCTLVEKLAGVSDRRLLKYLELLTLPSFPRESSPGPGEYNSIAAIDDSFDTTQFPDGGSQPICQPPYLPPEIKALILEKYYEAVFIPGEIEARTSPIRIGDDYFLYTDFFRLHVDSLASSAPKLYNEYKSRYWTENTIVSGPGQCSDTVEGLGEIPSDERDSIRSVRFILTKKDYGGRTRYQYYNDSEDLLDSLDDFEYRFGEEDQDLLDDWELKACTLFNLKLERLILDVSEAFSRSGDFLGLQFARSAPRFDHGIPRHFEVIASSQTLAKGVRRILEERNDSDA